MADDLDKDRTFEDDFQPLGGDDDEFGLKRDGGGAMDNVGVKIAIIGGVLALIVTAFILFAPSGGDSNRSQIRAPGASDVAQAPGTADLDPAMRDAIEEYNVEGIERATAEGESFVPIPVDPPTQGDIALPVDQSDQTDPLERWRMLQEQRAAQQAEVARQAPPPPVQNDQRNDAVNALAQSMLAAMQELAKEGELNFRHVIVTEDEFMDEFALEQANLANSLAMQQAGPSTASDPLFDAATMMPRVIIPEGEIEYAQTLIEANSDIPGPVLAQVLTGPLAGVRLIGQFDTADRHLVITFNTAVIDSQSIQINAIAVDPDNNLTGVVTDIDSRYLRRVLLPAAAEFVTGLAGAIAESGRTTITIEGDSVTETETDQDLTDEQEVAIGIETAADQVADFIEEEADQLDRLIRVEAGTPIGILFLEPLLDPEDVRAQQQAQARLDAEARAQNQMMFQFPGMNPNDIGTQNQISQFPVLEQ